MRPVRVTLEAPCPPAALFAVVGDLRTYPHWLDLVRSVEPHADGTWAVVLAARLGPLRRSKLLTMARTEFEPDRRVRFERREPDGRDHAAWVLEAGVVATASGSELTMTLHYDGQLFGPLVERVLSEQIASARPRLLALVTGS